MIKRKLILLNLFFLLLFLAVGNLAQAQNPWAWALCMAMSWLYWIAFVLAILIIVLAGYRFMASGGSPEKVADAKNLLIWAFIGFAVIAIVSMMCK